MKVAIVVIKAAEAAITRDSSHLYQWNRRDRVETGRAEGGKGLEQ